MHAYASGARGAQPIPFSATGRIIAIGSINSPMPCMMKEICAQRLAQNGVQEKLTALWIESGLYNLQTLPTSD